MIPDAFYRTFEHTADVGVEVDAPDIEELFSRSGLAMFDMMFGLESIAQTYSRKVQASGENLNDLLVAWLNELLYVYSVEGMIFSGFKDIDISEKSISAVGVGEIFDGAKHDADLEIKAATYHDLSIRSDSGRWKARIILDV